MTESASTQMIWMSLEEAIALLNVHAGGEASDDGFLTTLRPYRGLRPEAFHQVATAALTVIRFHPSDGPLNRTATDCLWCICNTTRHWGLDPAGMLRRNKLISDSDLELLEEWVEVFESLMTSFVGGQDAPRAASSYATYVAKHGSEGAPLILVELLSEQLDVGAGQWDVETSARALAAFGASAEPALPALKRAATRRYTHTQPVARETTEIQGVVSEAIATIETELRR